MRSDQSPLTGAQRGLVLRDMVEAGRIYAMRGPPAPMRPRHVGLSNPPLQQYVVLWDRLAVPMGRIDTTELTPDEEFLEDFGVLERRSARGAGATLTLFIDGHLEDEARDDQLRLFSQLEGEAPGRWAIASYAQEGYPEAYTNEGRALLVRLHDAIPVPHRNVSLDDALHFVERRKAEQLALRDHLDEVYLKIVAAGDGPVALRAELTRLRRAIEDQLAALESDGLRFSLAGLEAKMKWEFDPRIPAASAAAGGLLGSLQAAVAGAALGVLTNLMPRIELEWRGTLPRAVLTRRPFDYVLLMAEEL